MASDNPRASGATADSEVEPTYELDKSLYLARLARQNPSELLRVVAVALTTFKFRYIKRCAGAGSIIGPRTMIINSANVRIGARCWFQDRIYIRAGTQGRVEIGNRVAINSFVRMFGHGSIVVGDDTQIGPCTLITTTDHDFRGQMEAAFKPVRIGARAWIGANVTILPGVTIGDYAVIGAGSVVTKSIPARSVAVGVPARVIRRLEVGDASRSTTD